MGNGTNNGLAGEEKADRWLNPYVLVYAQGNEYGGSFPDVFLFHWDKEKRNKERKDGEKVREGK